MVIDFRTFFDMSQQMDRLLSDYMRPSLISQRAASYPPVNLSEDDGAVFVRAELPGVDKDSLDLTLMDKTLTIKGEIKAEKGKFFRQERPVGPFQRIISVGPKVVQEQIKASMKNGVLEVVLPKAEEEKPKKIAIAGQESGEQEVM